MRLWHYELLPYLPDLQFKGQLREIVAIMHDWRDKGATNHILINRVMDYPKKELYAYYDLYCLHFYCMRYGYFPNAKYDIEFRDFCSDYNCKDYYIDVGSIEIGDIDSVKFVTPIFKGWHNKEYLRCNMANLYEKHIFGKGKHKITDEEWQRLLDGYKAITGEDYVI